MTIEDEIRRELAKVLDIAGEDVPAEANLIGFGLHSLAIMALVGPLSRLAGARLDYADLAGVPSLTAWSALVEARRQPGRQSVAACGAA
ncbi:phosphopantetheine-binding protein [Labrys neptuniae]